MTICAIHQPNFFPWLGYFDKIRCADIFVFLDRVNYPKSGKSMGSWCNRVRLNVQGKSSWVQCPVVRERGVQPINTVRIDDRQPWRERMRETLRVNYQRTPNFEQVYPLVSQLLDYPCEFLSEFNINVIKELTHILGLSTHFVCHSEIDDDGLSSTARLVRITGRVGADTYLCGNGADGYQERGLFSEVNIILTYQKFTMWPYCQYDYLPGLSVIDFLMRSPIPYVFSVSNRK